MAQPKTQQVPNPKQNRSGKGSVTKVSLADYAKNLMRRLFGAKIAVDQVG